MENFRKLGLSEESINSLSVKGFEEPTEIQALVIPKILTEDKDIVAQAQTGTGKTAAFALPILEKIDSHQHGIQALILAPTRELVVQICDEIQSFLSENSRFTVGAVYGGQSITVQFKKLKEGLTIVVGTPGRILDHIRRKTLKLDQIKYFVLDEADEMLNMGFIEDVETIMDHTPKEKRVLLFSATIPDPIRRLAEKYMGDYNQIKAETNLTTDLTDQIYFEVRREDKLEALCRIIDLEKKFYGLVFCRTKSDVDELVPSMMEKGYNVDGLHGDISQAQREKILHSFKNQRLSVLIATDVAARGIDVSNLTHVINYSVPQNPESYIHRIGRTGRAGNQGTAITFITPSEFKTLNFIKKITKAEIRKGDIPNVDSIIEARRSRINDGIKNKLEAEDSAEYKEWARSLLENNQPEEVLSAVLHFAFGKKLNKDNYAEITPFGKQARAERLLEAEGKTRLFIAKGKHDFANIRLFINYLAKKSSVPQRFIRDVEIYDKYSFVNVSFRDAERILKTFRNQKKGDKSIVELASPKQEQK
ncbi:MAG TPA: RNA helicase [Lentisphaeria bacterium]|nr:MAG: RNA helicase [Lentisphaerae bacterium GWF2_38_69]HBM15036.1 RNA helicase [Lentisphaeria bacterium]